MADMNEMKRTWVEINIENALCNLGQIRKYTGAKVIAVVKADAYGHGVVEMAKAYQSAGVDCFAVACLQEAIELRDAGIEKDILILGATPAEGIPLVNQYKLTQTVFSSEYAKLVSSVMQREGKCISVHFKVDTGMGRLGFHCMEDDIEATAEEIVQAANLDGVKAEGLYMHFADAENPETSFTEKQMSLFENLLNKLEEKGCKPHIIHCANSAAVVNYKKAHLEYVRPGLILYGLYPDGKKIPELELKPVMSFKSVVSEIRTVRKGESISYGRTFTAERDMRVAVVPAGYGDGLARGLSGFAEFIIHGKRVPVLGRICMDMCVVDISGIEEVKVGDTVTLLGRDGDAEVLVDEWAKILGTISYEICCLITKRVPRVYFK